MTAIETRKKNIVELLADVQDEGLILQMENLLQAKHDFWNDLTDTQQIQILQGLADIKAGRTTDYQTFMQTL